MNKKGNTLSWFWRYRRLYWLHFMFCLVSRGATFSRLTTNWFCVWNVPFRDEDFLRIAIVRRRICLKLLSTVVFRKTSWFRKVRNSPSGSVCMIFYNQKWNFVSVKMTKMNWQPQSCKQLWEIDQTPKWKYFNSPEMKSHVNTL